MTALSLSVSQDYQWLVELFPVDGAGTEHAQYLATRDVIFSASDPTAPNREYDGRVLTALSVTRELYSDGQIGGASVPSMGTVEIAVDSAWIVANMATWRGYGWDGAAIIIRRGPLGSELLSEHTTIFSGMCSGENSFGATVSIGIGDLQLALAKDVQTTTYSGAGGFNGEADLKNSIVPAVFGKVYRAKPVWVDQANLWADLDPVRGLASVDAVYEGGYAMVADAANPPAAGKYYKDLANGRIRFTTKPVKEITVDCTGVGSTTAAGIASWIMQNQAGLSGKVDAASVTALDALNSSAVGYYVSDKTSCQDVIDALINSIGGFYDGSSGTVVFGRVDAPTATGPDDAAVSLYIEDADLELKGTSIKPEASPPYKVNLKHSKCWAGAYNENDFLGAASNAERAFMGEEFREESYTTAATATLHKLSNPLEIETLLTDATAAQTEVARRAGLYSVQREVLEIKIEVQPFGITLGSQVWVYSEIYGIDKAYRVIGVEESTKDNGRVAMKLWG